MNIDRDSHVRLLLSTDILPIQVIIVESPRDDLRNRTFAIITLIIGVTTGILLLLFRYVAKSLQLIDHFRFDLRKRIAGNRV